MVNNEKANEVVNAVIGRGIKWYDYNELKPDLRNLYYQQAQSVLKNNTWINELNHFSADLVHYIAKEAKDFDEVLMNRAMIVAIESFRERLAGIPDPSKEVSQDDLHNAI